LKTSDKKGSNTMSSARDIVEFTSTSTSTTVSRGPAGNLVTQINVEGQSKAFGPFAGTVTATGANKGGSWRYEAFAMPADNSRVVGSAEGSYEAVGQTRWRTVGSGTIETDAAIQHWRIEAEFDFAKRSWNGLMVPI